MDSLSTSYYSQYLLTACSVLTIAILLMFGIYLARPIKIKVAEVKELVRSGMNKPRFRKRDKVMFYGRKMLRKISSVKQKVKMISGQVRGPPGRKRKLVMKLARRLLPRRDHMPQSQLKNVEPPVEYLQEDISESIDQRLPPEVVYMLQNMRMFGCFEKPLFLELIKHIETVDLRCNQHLFMIGDQDTNMYIVQSGRLRVYSTEADGSTITLKEVKGGEAICSLLSFTDYLTGQPSVFKTVSAQAMEESSVLQLPVSAFQDVFDKHPDALVRAIQIIMVRLQRVTFLALHQYLGLSAELVKSFPAKHHGGSTSPIKLRMREHAFVQKPINVNDPMDCATPPTTPLSEGKRRVKDEKDYQLLLQVGIDGFVKLLGLEDQSLLDGHIEVRELIPGTYIMKEDAMKDVALVYVISGTLCVSQRAASKNEDVQMFLAHSGELVGGLAVLTGEPSFFTVRSRHTTCVAMLSKSTFYSIMSERPKVVLHIARTVIYRLSPFVRQIDFALDWVYIESGRALYRQEDESDCTYIVLSGRLRSVITHHDGKKELVGEYGRGDLVGIVETLTQNPRSTTVMAVRDTELAKLPEGLLDAIKLKFPMVVSRLINLLGHRILGTWQTQSSSFNQALQQRSVQSNFSTVAILPVSDDVPLSPFSHELYTSLSWIGPTVLLTSDYIRRTLGPTIMESANEYKLSAWLGQQEDQHKIVLYQCDQSLTPWTQRCIRQADCILIVALATMEPSVGTIEKQLETIAVRTQKELILLHKEGGDKPRNTVHWLNARSWCSSHHHIQCPPRIFSRKHASRLADGATKPAQLLDRNIHSDFSRLARLLTGESVGLVLGGGGARGAAHVGMIQAIQEAGIPIDMVGGVSIGAFMGALWCMEKDIHEVTRKASSWSHKMTQLWRQLVDLTYPVTSMFSGAGFNTMIRETFGEDSLIEDLWLPYFTITTDITSSCMRLHSHGSLWRSIRASMSIAGWLPPMCDEIDGHLLVDGCYVNNVPADVMRSRGAKHILAIDVGSQDDTDLTNYGDCLSGWWLLWKKWNPFASPVKVPNLPDIQSRLAYVSCVRQLEEVKKSDYCEYIRPPIDKYKTLQFGSFHEIKDVGYNHGKTYFIGLQKAGLLGTYTKPGVHYRESKKSSPTTYPSANSCYPYNQRYGTNDTQHRSQGRRGPQTFTDLAEMVAKVRGPVNRIPDDETSESGSDLEYDNDEVSNVSETYDDQDLVDHLNLRHRRKRSSLSCTDSEILSST
ncbi:neuropathy target esterase sws-like isoform X1 [Daphnia pulex]|uniref:neuropathy target esterase sws-like isoform X1 n=1 Tax=Daphnia pulex TaxID=6669 RepID=UPI001EDCE972|nr:neuropathy target esterase sws-like isoform X1 [Daphnia pulex]